MADAATVRGSRGSISQSAILPASCTTSKKVWTPQQARVEGQPFFFSPRKLPTPNRRTDTPQSRSTGNCSAIVTGSTPSESAGGTEGTCTQYLYIVRDCPYTRFASLSLTDALLSHFAHFEPGRQREQSTQGWTITRKWKIVPTYLPIFRHVEKVTSRERERGTRYGLRIAGALHSTRSRPAFHGTRTLPRPVAVAVGLSNLGGCVLAAVPSPAPVPSRQQQSFPSVIPSSALGAF